MCKPSTLRTVTSDGETMDVSKGLHHWLLILSKKHHYSLYTSNSLPCWLTWYSLPSHTTTKATWEIILAPSGNRVPAGYSLKSMNKKLLKNDNLYQKQCIFLSSPWKFMVGYINPVKPEVRGQKKKFYTISLVDISAKGKNGKSHSGRCLLSVQFRSRSSKYLYSNVKPSFFLWPHFS